ncbi:MAG: hypothetical protein Q8O84_02810, partial [Nanoarchaeota archaeon]|nr:hypothetical protein [Nanoarchaeota archaeon]
MIKHDFYGTYLFHGEKGNQKGSIYLNPENNFVGSLLDSGNGYKNVPYLVYGNLTSEKLRFLKIPEDQSFDNVFWS